MAESADDLIRQVAQRYAQCTSYRDEGVVKGTNYSTAFKTYFQRNYKFRVEWLNEGDASASAVWFDGKAVYRSLVGGPAKRIGAILFFPVKMLDVPMAISFLSNQTQGSASLIPSLLIKSVTSRSVLKIGPYMLMDDQIVRDTLCYHIQSDWRPMCKEELWISKKDLSILYYSSEYTQTPEERARTLEQLRATDPVRADAFDLAGTQTRIKQLEIQRCDFDISIPEAVYNEAL